MNAMKTTRTSVMATVIAGACAVLTLAGCNPDRVDKLEEGMSSEMDVIKQFGKPTDIVVEPDGSRTLEFTRQPEGTTNYFVNIGPDGKMNALRQVLNPAYFDKVKPGMTKDEVRRLLGTPAKKTFYDLKQQEDWDWRWMSNNQRKQFTVTFDKAGQALSTMNMDDPREGTQNR